MLPASSIFNKIENVSHWGYLNLEKGAGPLCDGKCFLGDGEKRLSPEQHREDEDAYWDKRKNSLGILSLKGCPSYSEDLSTFGGFLESWMLEEVSL